MSQAIRSGSVRRASSIPSAPSAAVSSRWPADRSRRRNSSRSSGLSSMSRIRAAISGLLRQDESERAPLAELALEFDAAAEQARELLAEVQPQAGPFVPVHAGVVPLLERPEQPGLV